MQSCDVVLWSRSGTPYTVVLAGMSSSTKFVPT